MPARKLPYDLRWQYEVEGQGDNYPVSIPVPSQFPIDPDEKTYICFELSLNEFVKIASALDVGRDIAYPEEEVKLWDIWSGRMVDICQLVADCINNPDSPVSQALKDFNLSNSNPNAPTVGGTGQGDTENMVGAAAQGCGFDEIYGNCVSFREQLHQNTLDFFDVIEAVTNNQEAAAKIVGAIPLLETLPIDDIMEMGDNFRQFIVDGYNATYTLTLAQEFECELFCLAQENCELTVKDAFDLLSAKLIGAFPEVENVWNTLETCIALINFSGEIASGLIVWSFWCAQLGLANTLNNAFGFSMSDIIVNTKLGTPANDWQLLCDDCSGAWEHIFDFTAGTQGWTIPQPTQTIHVIGEGFQTDAASFGQVLIQLNTATRSYPDMHCVLEFETIAGQIGAGNRYLSYYLSGGLIQTNEFTQLTNTTEPQPRELDLVAVSADRIEIGAGARANGSGTITLKRAIFSGFNNENPF